MREGYWINYETMQTFPIHEHEEWIREEDNARQLGVSENVISMFDDFEFQKDRLAFLSFLMKNAPIMRVRGHGAYMTFEYATRSRKPVEAAWLFGLENAGPFSTMVINNLETGEQTAMKFQEMQKIMDTSGPEGIMRAATSFSFNENILNLVKEKTIKMNKKANIGKRNNSSVILKRLKMAGGMSRIYNWLTNNQFGIISAIREERTSEENIEKTKDLKKDLVEMGYGYYPADGFYAGVPEKSFFVPKISLDELIELGNKYDQYSILHGDNGEYGFYVCSTGALEFPQRQVAEDFTILQQEEMEEMIRDQSPVGFTSLKKEPKRPFTLDPSIEEWRAAISGMSMIIVSDATKHSPMGNFQKVVKANKLDGYILSSEEGNYNIDGLICVLPLSFEEQLKNAVDDTNFRAKIHPKW